MRFLFLDDDPERHDGFDIITTQAYPDAHVDHVWTVDEFRKAISLNDKYDCVFLDHDLDLQQDPETGTEAAEFVRLHLNLAKYPTKVVVHSWNPDGARRMANLISSVGIPVRLRPYSAPRRSTVV